MAKSSIIKTLWRHRAGYMFIAPFYILFATFWLYPILYSLRLSVQKSVGLGKWQYVGLSNYQYLFQDPIFLRSLWNTVYIFLGNVPLMTFLALILAFVFNSKFVVARSIFRTIYLLPYVTASIVVAIVFSIFFDQEFGIINTILATIGLPRFPWLLSTDWSKAAIIIVVTWKWVGYNMILMLSGLQTIPPDVYEAASIDGATTTQSFFRITIPLMKPTILFCLIMSTIGTFSVLFDEPYVLTGGGPNYSSTPLTLYLYYVAFNYFKFGYASSIAIVISFLVFLLSYLQFILFQERG
ncbi:MAG: sugar ABC transporter permease [Firmicutes bacterium]|nr:sugar ABC transporter permease [Bacillota bacterium]